MPRHEFKALGTSWCITTPEPLPTGDRHEISALVDTFDRTYSRFRPDATIAALRWAGGSCEFPEDAAPMLALYRELYDLTDGAVSPLVGNALVHWGYDEEYSLTAQPGPARVARWDDTLQLSGSRMSTREPVVLDFGAAGKGRLVDIISEYLLGRGHRELLVDGSGDLRGHGGNALLAGLESPFAEHQVIGVVNVENAALAGSAVNRRRWGTDRHHLLDGRTGAPVTDVVATWVLADSAMLADALATALFVTEPEILARAYDFSFVRIRPDGSAEFSAHFPGELFS